MNIRQERVPRTAGTTFSMLLEKLGESVHLSQNQTQAACVSDSMSHSQTSPRMYCSQPDVDITHYAPASNDSNQRSTKHVAQENNSVAATKSSTPDSYYSTGYQTEESYAEDEEYSYYSTVPEDYSETYSDDSASQYSVSERPSPISKGILREIIQNNPKIRSQLSSRQGALYRQSQDSDTAPRKFTIEEIKELKAMGEDIMVAAQTILQEEARKQRKTSERLSQPKRRRILQKKQQHQQQRYQSQSADGSVTLSKRRRPAVVLEVPQLDRTNFLAARSGRPYSATTISKESKRCETTQATDQATTTDTYFQDSTSSEEQPSEAPVLTKIIRDYVSMQKPVVQEHSPKRLSISHISREVSASASAEPRLQPRLSSDLIDNVTNSAHSVATPQELLASVILASSIPNTHSSTEGQEQKQAVPARPNTNVSPMKKSAQHQMRSSSAGSKSRPLSSSALELSRELPEPASRLLLTNTATAGPSNPTIDLTLTATVPKALDASARRSIKLSTPTSQQLRASKMQSEQTIKELKEKISALEVQLSSEKQRNVSTSRELKSLRERKRILETQLKKEIEHKDNTVWETQRKALKMNMALIKTISSMNMDRSVARTEKTRPRIQMPSHIHSSRPSKSASILDTPVIDDPPLIEVAPPITNLAQVPTEALMDVSSKRPKSSRLVTIAEPPIQANEIIVCSHNMQHEEPVTATATTVPIDLNKVFVDTCNRTIREALADVCDPNSAGIPVLSSEDIHILDTENTPPPSAVDMDVTEMEYETEASVDKKQLVSSDLGPEVILNRDRHTSNNDQYDKNTVLMCNIPIDKKLFQKNLHIDAAMILAQQSKNQDLKPPAAPVPEKRAQTIKRYGECVALFLQPNVTQYPPDTMDITNLIVSISTDIASAPGLGSNEKQYLTRNLRLVREVIERSDLSIFSYPLFSAKLIAAMFCAYGNASFPVYSTIIYRISDLLIAEIANSSGTSSNTQLYSIECKLYIYILNVIRGVCLLTIDAVIHTDLQPGENSFKIASFAFSSLNEFVASSNVMLENTALYTVVSVAIEILLSGVLKDVGNPLSLSMTPVVKQSSAETVSAAGAAPISEAAYKSLQDVVIATVSELCNQLLSSPGDEGGAETNDHEQKVQHYPSHSLCSIATLTYSISMLLRCKDMSLSNSALLARQRQRVLSTIPAVNDLNLIPDKYEN